MHDQMYTTRLKTVTVLIKHGNDRQILTALTVYSAAIMSLFGCCLPEGRRLQLCKYQFNWLMTLGWTNSSRYPVLKLSSPVGAIWQVVDSIRVGMVCLQELTNIVNVVLDGRLNTLGRVRHDYQPTGDVWNIQLTSVHRTINNKYKTPQLLYGIHQICKLCLHQSLLNSLAANDFYVYKWSVM